MGRPYKYSVDDYVGRNFNDWTVLGFSHSHPKSRNQYWMVRCICGEQKSVSLTNLFSGESKRCTKCSQTKRLGSKNRLWTGGDFISGDYFSSVKNGAKDRNINFDITIEDLENLFKNQKGICRYTGEELEFGTKKLQRTASLDRIDSNKGYTKDNIQFVHKILNLMKLDKAESEFLEFVKLIYEYRLKTV